MHRPRGGRGLRRPHLARRGDRADHRPHMRAQPDVRPRPPRRADVDAGRGVGDARLPADRRGGADRGAVRVGCLRRRRVHRPAHEPQHPHLRHSRHLHRRAAAQFVELHVAPMHVRPRAVHCRPGRRPAAAAVLQRVRPRAARGGCLRADERARVPGDEDAGRRAERDEGVHSADVGHRRALECADQVGGGDERDVAVLRQVEPKCDQAGGLHRVDGVGERHRVVKGTARAERPLLREGVPQHSLADRQQLRPEVRVVRADARARPASLLEVRLDATARRPPPDLPSPR
mmetsp:Transcript_23463/g.56497  ORF Transcript_23463/g.56497 Transcript_23463/m.56497 type:complete len:289 (-) Transcript_23463:754-1620(-)